MCHNQFMQKKGFTLIEVLIVVAIVTLLIITLTLSLVSQRSKAEDARDRTELDRLRIAFVDYYNDNNCYPPKTWFDAQDDCGSNNLAPYLAKISCNKITGMPYVVVTDDTGCGWFELSTDLRHPTETMLCESSKNYCLGSANHIFAPKTPAPSSIPTPTPVNTYYCQNVGNCAAYDTVNWNCTPNYPTSACATGCSHTGSCTHR